MSLYTQRFELPSDEQLQLEQNLLQAADEAEQLQETLAAGQGSAGIAGVAGASAAAALLEMAADIDLFVSTDGTAFGTFAANGHRETWPVNSRQFKSWLRHQFYDACGNTPNSQALLDVIGTLEGRAQFGSGPPRDVYVRFAPYDGKIYFDLGDPLWRVVEISSDGWRVIDQSPVCFQRFAGMLAVPEPIPGGNISELRPFLNLDSDADWVLFVGYLVGAMQPNGPFAILLLHGEQGSAKSTTLRVFRDLIDPNKAPLRCLPANERDLAIAATNAWLVVLDNLSFIPPNVSDAICRLATGGGFATRALYTDGEEKIFDSKRPVLINGIEEIANRGDLLDRSILVYLPEIPPERRRLEADFWRDFNEARPRILGALLDAVAGALRNRANVQLPQLPRMADFVHWVTAAEPGLGLESGTFLRAYQASREHTNVLALDASPVAAQLRATLPRMLLDADRRWRGTATELLNELQHRMSDGDRRRQQWPKNARALANKLRRLTPSLRATGITIDLGDRSSGRNRDRLITIRVTGDIRAAEPGFTLAIPDDSDAEPEQGDPNANEEDAA